MNYKNKSKKSPHFNFNIILFDLECLTNDIRSTIPRGVPILDVESNLQIVVYTFIILSCDLSWFNLGLLLIRGGGMLNFLT